MPAITVHGLTKSYGQTLALQDLSFEVEDGEVFGFLGPNGAGKSTTINVLLDFVRPTDGRVEVLGLDAQTHSREIRSRTGVLPEGYQVYDRLTGRQHLEFAIDSKGVDADPDRLLERVGIADAADKKAGGYSKGMAQRLMLAMALVGDPDLLILDEPATGLDPNGAREMREIVRAENDRGATVFFSSHRMEQVEAVCDRVGILRNGEMVAVDSVEGLRDSLEDGTTLRVTVDRIDDDTLQAVRSLSEVSSATVEDGGQPTLVVGVDGSKTAVLGELEDHGIEVRDFSTQEASLEDVFQSYTTEAETGVQAR
ncbi:ABC transporter ATP-binding protein [Natronobacterium gregoryi]|uniref:ABC transporter n=2 Tax=Natronobacterium gregoryi TaxID=44930 RepID=L0AGG6_NATGS|nr:ABC transporter ATP-binding protein [Natronobacterium gregoryi]AFZ72916.1 ABC-type multidrug transport system, ATPase component [Natronobacterium gregoryi SP2]ELY69788.1 ABC transporter [Natronobacterium gregoryi SP2]PLK21856.1 ABC transporter ATP-binding protein [Natronobacterium gregoryi SP2]SFI67176.1 ABC-2 type transport system ATP-binding protein [Natronobacterium gregoryi]